MLILVTGSPGAGKTSNTLWDFLHNPDYLNRPRFCSDIPDFDRAIHGIGDLDALDNWQDLPDGSVVLVDEAQRFLRPRSSRQVPEWIGAFETHRHRGFDFIFITQHPSLIDTHVRRLIGRHVHYHRPFGLKTASRYTWEFCCESPDEFNFRKAERARVAPNPQVFKLYKSTVLDTHKRRLPWKMIVIGCLALVAVVGGLAYPFLHYGKKSAAAPASSSGSAQPAPVVSRDPRDLAPVVDLAPSGRPVRTIADYVPRIDSMPWTAPIYDDLTEPTDFPRIAACISSEVSCHCYTQQATPVSVPVSMCLQIVKQGIFDPWASGRANLVPGSTVTAPDVERDAKRGRGHPDEPVSQNFSKAPSYTFDVLGASGYRPDPS